MSDVHDVEDLMLRAETMAPMKANIKFNELKRKIKDWHDRIEKATMNVSTHLFREVIEVVREMEKELSDE